VLHGEIIALCSQIHTKHINTLCWQNVELLDVKLAALKVTTGLLNIYRWPLFMPSFTPCCFNAPCHFTALLSYTHSLAV
jgi:hypothetical protein